MRFFLPAAAAAATFATAAIANTEADVETFVEETFVEEMVIAPIVAHVDISEQRMILEVDGEAVHVWEVSTARPGKETPTGIFDVEWLSAKHRSSLYNNAPMPWSIFYDGDYAIHGTTDVAALGTPASAGCVRLHPDNAKILFKMVTKRGYDSLKVVIND